MVLFYNLFISDVQAPYEVHHSSMQGIGLSVFMMAVFFFAVVVTSPALTQEATLESLLESVYGVAGASVVTIVLFFFFLYDVSSVFYVALKCFGPPGSAVVTIVLFFFFLYDVSSVFYVALKRFGWFLYAKVSWASIIGFSTLLVVFPVDVFNSMFFFLLLDLTSFHLIGCFLIVIMFGILGIFALRTRRGVNFIDLLMVNRFGRIHVGVLVLIVALVFNLFISDMRALYQVYHSIMQGIVLSVQYIMFFFA
eukprot:gene44366-1894_t